METIETKKDNIIECPVCNKKCKSRAGVSSHLFKTKDEAHLIFIEQQNKIIYDAFDSDITCEKLAEQDNCWVIENYIRSKWSELPGYKERVSRMNSLSVKKQWAEGTRVINPNFTNTGYKYNLEHKNTIDKEVYNKIISFFDTTLSFKQIAEKTGCDPKSVRPTFIREFGEEMYKKRVKSVRKATTAGGRNKIENTNPELYKKIIAEFYGDKGIWTIAREFKTYSGVIINSWIRKFGEGEYEKRVAKMLKIQRVRAAKSLKKAKFLGSKNEILCYSLLEELLPYKVEHHDYTIVPRLEIDISVPEIKIAICWDGIGHRKPVFGEEPFKCVSRNDIQREKTLKKKGWRHISVIDNGSHDPKFVEEKVSEIVELINTDWAGKIEI